MRSQVLPGFGELLKFVELRPDATQASDDFGVVYANAKEAQKILTTAIAREWEVDPDPKLSFLNHAVEGTQNKEWIEMADDPGVKGEARAREKMENDYKDQNGVPHANKLKDLARLTLRFTQPAKVVQTLKELRTLGFTIVILKNKYANPTPLGYCACPSRIKAAAPLALLAQTAERPGMVSKSRLP